MTNDRSLLAFALGSFHAVLLTMLLVLGLYLAIDLGDALEDASTALGLAIFVALWATSVYCTHSGLKEARMKPGELVPTSRILHAGGVWGAKNGILFFWCLLAGFICYASAAAVFSDQPEDLYAVFVISVVAAGFGTPASAFIGSAVGFLTALLDLALLAGARALVGSHTTREGSSIEDPSL